LPRPLRAWCGSDGSLEHICKRLGHYQRTVVAAADSATMDWICKLIHDSHRQTRTEMAANFRSYRQPALNFTAGLKTEGGAATAVRSVTRKACVDAKAGRRGKVMTVTLRSERSHNT
jgi:hypothetical protein